MTHTTELVYNAGTRTYKVRCATCGYLRGVSTTRKDAEAKGAAHRREQREVAP